MTAPQWSLLAKRRFLPLFATQFLGAFNDNLYRAAMLFLIAFRLMPGEADQAALAAVVAGGIFILPYFLFSSLAGQLADRMDKARLARIVKLAEVGIAALGALALLIGHLPLLYLTLFALGVHSTVFGPIKYAMLPQHLGPAELMGGTALVEAGTFLAILLGQLSGGLLPPPIAAGAVLAVAVAGLGASLFIPPAPAGAERPAVDANLVRASAAMLRHSAANRALFLAIVGITWFFSLGGVLMQQIPALASRLNADKTVAALFTGLFSVGVGIGSMLVGRLLGGRISARYVPVAALLLAAGVIDLSFTVHRIAPAPVTAGIAGFLALDGSLRLAADLLFIAVAGGAFIVPLYALLQTLGRPDARSRDVAANNIVNAAGMVGASLLVSLMLARGAGMQAVFLLLGLIGLAVALGIRPLARGARAG